MGANVQPTGSNLTDIPDMVVREGDDKLVDAFRAHVAEKYKKAKYKIEILFGKNRTLREANNSVVTVWLQNSRFYGNGDQLLYRCSSVDFMRRRNSKEHFGQPGKSAISLGCGSVLPPECYDWVKESRPPFRVRQIAVCPHCQRRWSDMSLTTSETYYHNTPAQLAIEVAKVWRMLLGDTPKGQILPEGADLYIRYHPSDIRNCLQNAATLETTTIPEALTVYPLERIIVDTQAGASVEGRFESLFQW